MDLAQLTSKLAYRLLRPVRHPRCLTTFGSFHVDWPALWDSLDLIFVDRAVWQTNWLSAHGIHHLFCHCGVRESQHHLFVDCPLARFLFYWFEQLIFRLHRPIRGLSATVKRFGFATADSIPAGFQFLLACIH